MILRTHIRFLLIAGLWTAVAAPRPATADDRRDILVVINRSIQKKKVSIDELRDYFLKKRLNWPSGRGVVPINAKSDSDLRAAFRRAVLEMTETEESRYWQDSKIKAGAKKPPELGNNLRAVFKIKGAISYVYRRDYKEGVVDIVLVLPAKPAPEPTKSEANP